LIHRVAKLENIRSIPFTCQKIRVIAPGLCAGNMQMRVIQRTTEHGRAGYVSGEHGVRAGAVAGADYKNNLISYSDFCVFTHKSTAR
jgi:hypothetical protein